MNHQLTQRAIPITDSELRALLLEYRRENWSGIQLEPTQRQVVEDLIHGDAEGPLRQVEPYFAISSNARILDLGSGAGSFVVACRRRGLRAFGLEPDRIGQGAKITSIQIARRRLVAPVFVSGVGEELPFPDTCFDLSRHESSGRPCGRPIGGCPGSGSRGERGRCDLYRLPKLFALLRAALQDLLGAIATENFGPDIPSPAQTQSSDAQSTDLHLQPTTAEAVGGTGPGLHSFGSAPRAVLEKTIWRWFCGKINAPGGELTQLPFLGPVVLWAILMYGSIAEGGCEMLVLRKPEVANR